MNGQASRRIEVTRSGAEDTRRRTFAGLWVALLLAILTFLAWAGVIVLGRLIAYDHVWGSWSPATKA